MKISDAILESNTEHEIFFLLTAYVEAVRYCDKLGTLPEELTRLPLSGADGFQNKLVGIRVALDRDGEDGGGRRHGILKEAAEIFGVAVNRLDRLAASGIVHGESPTWREERRT